MFRIKYKIKILLYNILYLINEVINKVNELLRKGIENDNIIILLMFFLFYSVVDCR